jgi:glycosyltransferase involved in cell wall biosynthesis
MKICYIAASVIPSRAANSVHVMKMCQAYARLGHEVSLLVPEQPEDYEPDVADIFAFYGVEPNFRILRYRPRRPFKFWLSLTLPFKAVRATRADWYHSRLKWTAWGLVALGRKATLLEVHEVPPPGSWRERFLRSSSKHGLLKAVIAITGALKGRLEPLVRPGTRIEIEPDGVDSACLQNQASKATAREALGLENSGGPLVVYSGHLYAGRGIEIVVELARRHPDHRFRVVGGREKDVVAWKSQTADLGNLQFVGFVPPAKVFTWLRAADVLVMPYAHKVSHAGTGETAAVCSPMKMFEYLGAGRPIIASDLPVLQEVLRPGKNCLVAAYDDVEAWSRALLRLQSDPALAERLSVSAHEDAASYTWEARAGRLVNLVQPPHPGQPVTFLSQLGRTVLMVLGLVAHSIAGAGKRLVSDARPAG